MDQVCTKKFQCPVEVTLDLIGGKYKALILWHLTEKTLRFSELRKLIPNATQKVMTQQLRDLERDGIIKRKVYSEVPPKVEYSISDLGKTMRPILEAMCEWGGSYLNNNKDGIQ